MKGAVKDRPFAFWKGVCAVSRNRRGRNTVHNQPTGAGGAIMRLMGVIHAVFGFTFVMVALDAIIPSAGLFGLPFLLAGGFFAINGVRMAIGKNGSSRRVTYKAGRQVPEDTILGVLRQKDQMAEDEVNVRVSEKHACALDSDGRLRQLKTLKDAGIMDEKEYRKKVQEIMSGR